MNTTPESNNYYGYITDLPLDTLLKSKLGKSASIDYINNLDETGWIKTKDDLIKDYLNCETMVVLHNDEIALLTFGGTCQIQRGDGKWLVEYRQEFKSGKVTNRNIPVSGKLIFNKDYKSEMSREVQEELTLPKDGFTIELNKVHNPRYIHSTGYPNLKYIVVLNEFIGHIKPEYIKPEYIEYQEKKTNYYHWVKEKPEFFKF